MTRPVAGLDPSLTGCGVATETTTTTITSKPATTVSGSGERLVTIAHQVALLLDPGSLVVIEAPAYSRQLGAGHHLSAGLWWTLVIELTHRGHDVISMTPSGLKRLATGKGTATKADMRMSLYQRAGLDLRDDDQVDAWWLRQAGLHLTDHDDAMPLPNHHLTALDPLRGVAT